MYSPHVFAVLTAHDERKRVSSAFELPHNLRWFCEGSADAAFEPTISSREPTPAIDSQSEDDSSRLVVSFDKLTRIGQSPARATVRHEYGFIPQGHRGTGGISGKQVGRRLEYKYTAFLPFAKTKLVQHHSRPGPSHLAARLRVNARHRSRARRPE
jgi:hypothetical protein